MTWTGLLPWLLAVRTFDTNMVVRLLIGDDPQQTPIAEKAFLDAIASGGVYLPDVVLAEVAWVLRGYNLERTIRYQLLERLVRTRGVVVDDIDDVGTPGRVHVPAADDVAFIQFSSGSTSEPKASLPTAVLSWAAFSYSAMAWSKVTVTTWSTGASS